MHSKTYERFQETVYTEQLSNGLQVYILAKSGFQKTYATFSTRYGSIDHHFQVEGDEACKVPDGIAHFLEHKMFEEPKGDVFAQFASQGASANAFTSFDRTVYLFSATEQIENSVETLLNFVQNPYFTDDNVEKEKGIIAQEINMYKDHPDWQSYFGLFAALYQKHPIHIDIAGTVDSIYQINKELLYLCYNTFYHPSNMSLFIVGDVDPEKMLLLIRDNQAKKQFPQQGRIHRYFDKEPKSVKEAKIEKQLTISMPKCLIGYKDRQNGLQGQALLQRECLSKLMLDILFGASSTLYQELYDEGLITDGFGSEYNCDKEYGFSVIGGDTPNPEGLVEKITSYVKKIQQEGIEREKFERSRKKKIGGFLRMLNSPEALANEFTRYQFRNQDLFDVPEVYEQLSLEDVQRRIKEHFHPEQIAVSVVKRKSEQNG